MNLKKNKWGYLLLACLCMQSLAFAADKTFFIIGTNIRRAGSPVTITNAAALPNANFRFTHTLLTPGVRTPITDFAVRSGAVDALGSPVGRNVLVDSNLGQTIGVRVWTPTEGPGNYYGDTSIAMNEANWNDSALTWNWTNLALDYKADAPYEPAITGFTETVSYGVDEGAGTSTLNVASRHGTGTDGLREVTRYAWRFWEPRDVANPAADEPTSNLEGATAQTLSLGSDRVQPGHLYAFRVANGNTWNAPDWVWSSRIYTHRVASGGTVAAGAITTAWNLNRPEGGLGINTISFPFGAVTSPAAMTTVADMITQVNAVVTSGRVTSVGWWNSTTQTPNGYIVMYENDSARTPNRYMALGGTAAALPDAPSGVNLTRDQAYQVSISGTGSFTVNLTGTR